MGNRLGERVTMKKVWVRWSIVMICAVLLAGCARTPEPIFYTLDMRSSGEFTPRWNLEIDRLRPTEALARQGILIEASPTEITYYADALWASGLEELVAEKLSTEFGPASNDRATVMASGKIQHFAQQDTPEGAQAHIQLDITYQWAEADRDDAPLLHKVYRAQVPSPSLAVSDVVTAMSQGLEAIAAEMAEDVGAFERP